MKFAKLTKYLSVEHFGIPKRSSEVVVVVVVVVVDDVVVVVDIVVISAPEKPIKLKITKIPFIFN